MRLQRILISSVGCVLALSAFSACRSDGRTLRPADPSQNASVFTASTTTTVLDDTLQPAASDESSAELPAEDFTLRTPAIPTDGDFLDARFTCSAAGVSPPFSWTGVPADTTSLALVVTDLDANNFVHWVIANISPSTFGVPSDDVPVGAIEGTNGASTAAVPSVGWTPPCPPKGTTHHYRFTLYALDQQIDLPTGSPSADIMTVIDNSSLLAAQLTGVYTTP
ncbi:MAG: YbhB/YbcL family Raf kinase inhibitor-like protein [Actinomycetota bacterium]